MDLELRRSRMKAWMPPLKSIFPEWITARLVQSDSTSERMWEDITIVPPSFTKSLKIDRNWTTPAGSIPIMGSSRMRTFGVPHHGLRDAQPLDHPLAELGDLVVLILDKADVLEQDGELVVRRLAA